MKLGMITSETFNYILLGFFIILGYFLLKEIRKLSKIRSIYNPKQTKKKHTSINSSFFERLSYFKSLKSAINDFYFFKKNSGKKIVRMNLIILIVEFSIIIGSYFVDKFVVGFALTVIIHYVIIAIIRISSIDISVLVQNELPMIIKHFIKVMSKTSDIKVIIYETSKHMNEPLKYKFEILSRRMLSESDEKCLNEFADEINDIWMYSFIFLVLSLKEQSKREDVIDNLKMLASIMDEQNITRAKDLAEKKPMILMNYAVAILAIIGGIANIMFNEIGKDYFFNSGTGIIVFIVGVSCILLTFVVNTLLSKKTQGGR